MKFNIHIKFCYEERPFNRKDKVSSFYFARDIGEKWGNKPNHPVKIDLLFTDFFSNFAYKLSRLSSLNP